MAEGDQGSKALEAGADKVKNFKSATKEEKDALINERLLMQTIHAVCVPPGTAYEDAGAQVTSAVALVQSIKPADDIEAMLATQMVAIHNALMDCMRRAAVPSQSPEGFDLA